MNKTRPTTTANNNEAQTMTGTITITRRLTRGFLNPSPLAGRVGAKRRGGVSFRLISPSPARGGGIKSEQRR